MPLEIDLQYFRLQRELIVDAIVGYGKSAAGEILLTSWILIVSASS